MKKFNKNLIVFVLAIALVLGFTGPNTAHATLATDFLGVATGYSVFGDAGISEAGTISPATLWGDIGINGVVLTPSASGEQVGTFHATDPSSTIVNATGSAHGALAAESATGGNIDLTTTNNVGPGVYTITGGGVFNQTLTLTGSGTYIFKYTGTIAQSGSGTMILGPGATACNVYWYTPTDMTFATGGNFFGTISAGTAITFAAAANLQGRAWAGTYVALHDQTITEPVCTAPTPPVVRRSSSGSSPRITQPTSTNPAILTIIKQVVNNGGSTATASIFNLHVKNSGVDVLGSPNKGIAAPGIYYSLPVGTYVISEDANPSYARTFSGDCDLNGSVTLSASQNKTCVVTNTHIFVPSLPKTGFPPQESGTWYESLLNNILNLFR